MEIQNAQITSTFLGIEDHGCMTFLLQLSGDGWSQAWGGMNLNSLEVHWPGVIRAILDCFGVDSWEKLKGQYLCVKWNNDNRQHQPMIGHLVKDRWIILENLLQDFKR